MGQRAIACRQCGTRVVRGSPAVYCLPCADERNSTRISNSSRQRPVERGLRQGGNWVCLDCKTPIAGRIGRGRLPVRCTPCGQGHRERLRVALGRDAAGLAVRRAVAAGALKPAKEHACVDCGARADCYDHRDYARQLDVEPVCFSCNSVRGPAKPIPAPLEA